MPFHLYALTIAYWNDRSETCKIVESLLFKPHNLSSIFQSELCDISDEEEPPYCHKVLSSLDDSFLPLETSPKERHCRSHDRPLQVNYLGF